VADRRLGQPQLRADRGDVRLAEPRQQQQGKGKAEVVNDPYYGGRDGFEKAFEQCSRFAKNFLNEVVGKQ